jgi:hypothetical protein
VVAVAEHIDRAERIAQHLVDVTANLGTYIEDQAQQIARPKIATAEQAFERRIRSVNERHEAELSRSSALLAELRRQITALDKFQEKALLREKRVRAVADDLDARDLREAATDVRNALNFVGHMKAPAAGSGR